MKLNDRSIPVYATGGTILNPFHSSGLLDYFDVGEPSNPGPVVDMATAIASIHTPQGFVICAEGRKCRDGDFAVLSDSEQKIFRAETKHALLSFTIAGTAEIKQIGTGDTLFEFASEVSEGFSALAGCNTLDFPMLARRLAEYLMVPLREAKNQRLRVAGEDFRISTSHTYIGLNGYFRRQPKRIGITFNHAGIAQSETTYRISVEPRWEITGYGSSAVLGLLERRDHRFERFQPAHEPCTAEITLDHAIQIAHNRVAAQCSPQAREIDPRCACMGGRIHIATLTIENGFSWVDGYAPHN